MVKPEEIHDLEEARNVIRALQKVVARMEEMQRRIDRLEAENRTLKGKVEELTRGGKRQAAPFSRGEPKEEPKKPGQKAGHEARHRAAPEKIDRVLKAALPEQCECGGGIVRDDEKKQIQIDVPRPIPVTVTQFDVEIGHCAVCGRRHQGRHEEQTSDALGAAGVQIGPNTLGIAAELKHRHGMSYGALSGLIRSLTGGFTVARSTLARADQRMAERLKPTYERLILRLNKQEVVHVDETGWRVSGRSAWLWVFTSRDIVVYAIDPTRSHDVVERILTKDFAGVLKSDCFTAYDSADLEKIEKSKCLGHLIRRCSELRKDKRGRAVMLSRKVQMLLRYAIRLKDRRQRMSNEFYSQARAWLEKQMDLLLCGRYTDEDNARLVRLLKKQRRWLFNFLDHDACDATNNAAERAIRPAVIIRKTNGCNRTPAGAHVHEVIASVLQSWSRQGVNFGVLLSAMMRLRGLVELDFGGQSAVTR